MKIVEKLFTYDSSFICTTKDELKKFKSDMTLKKLKILTIFQKKIAKFSIKKSAFEHRRGFALLTQFA